MLYVIGAKTIFISSYAENVLEANDVTAEGVNVSIRVHSELDAGAELTQLVQSDVITFPDVDGAIAGTFTPSTAITPADTLVIVVSVACQSSIDHTPRASLVLSTTPESGNPVQFVRVPDAGVPSA